ncbi:MAG TPA: hypothetical protein VJQ56_09095 [Blastocatellia bacterium]|nr:hypothetical protein [Blastocatellia bacterium]
MARRIVVLVISLLALSFSVLADGGKLEATGPLADAAVSSALKESLESKGHRVTLAGGQVLCEIWLKRSIQPKAKDDVSGAIYTELGESTLIGVISFPKATKDYRGQGIKPGAYTLRYALHPADGNHLGISTYRDFLVMSPVASDADPEARFKFDELVKLSAKTLGGNHPSPVSLVSAQGGATLPAVYKDSNGHLVFEAKLKTQAGAELPIAFVVEGEAAQ